VLVENDGVVESDQQVDDPLTWIEDYQRQFREADVPGLPRFTGGLVGYFGYDTIRYIEPRLANGDKPDALHTPDILLMVSEEVVVFDNLSGKLYFILQVAPTDEAYQQGQARLAALEKLLRESLPSYQAVRKSRKVTEEDFISGFTEQGFKDAVRRAKEYIVEGDIMQVVLSQRLSIPYEAPPLDLYRSLRVLNPSPYMYYLDLGDHHVVGSSPEILVRLEDSQVTVRPIAGTRPRGHDEAEDLALEQELLADPKELAEHLMLIDLGRNDAGRVSKTGSVRLTDKMIIERYSHVMHIVSNVSGELNDNMSAMDVLRATFPAGTVSGAPKIRAMEIIDELEPVKRGIYSGAVGYLSWNGNMDTAIAIRTAVIKDKTLHIQAGAGIVYDSVPDNEWAETMNKGRAVFRAVAMAEAGLDGSHR
jgi:anthranilate synthase component 1